MCQQKRTRPWCAGTSKWFGTGPTSTPSTSSFRPTTSTTWPPPSTKRGFAGVKHVLNWLFAVFPDHRFDIEEAVADGETVAVRGTCSGTHEGELWGIPPTGERFAAQQSHWFRVDDGKVAEHWAVRDDLGMIRQLGIAPA